jgi:hypothetical protein
MESIVFELRDIEACMLNQFVGPGGRRYLLGS